MKILFVFTLHLISGPVSCFDVIGYPQGAVIIFCSHRLRGEFKYFCEEKPQKCAYMRSHTPYTQDQKYRFTVHDSTGGLMVIYRNLSLQDAGSYQCGETGMWENYVNLKMNSDPCCLGSNTVAGYLGETVTINCSYPEDFKRSTKLLFKQDGQDFEIVIDTTVTQKGRFSMSEDRRSKVLSVGISDVREADGGLYYCGVWRGGESVSYLSLYTETQLQVNAIYRTSTTAPTTVKSSKTFSSPVIISISVCVVLLLIGGLALIFCIVIHRKKQGFTPSFRTELNTSEQVSPVASNNDDTGAYANASSPTNTPDKDIIQPHQDSTYTTVSFRKNPASPADTSAVFSQEESATEYATIRHHTDLE
ncbi:hypothetical protein SRHO_G00177530 [Serrasalmus rhombeus]